MHGHSWPWPTRPSTGPKCSCTSSSPEFSLDAYSLFTWSLSVLLRQSRGTGSRLGGKWPEFKSHLCPWHAPGMPLAWPILGLSALPSNDDNNPWLPLLGSCEDQMTAHINWAHVFCDKHCSGKFIRTILRDHHNLDLLLFLFHRGRNRHGELRQLKPVLYHSYSSRMWQHSVICFIVWPSHTQLFSFHRVGRLSHLRLCISCSLFL